MIVQQPARSHIAQRNTLRELDSFPARSPLERSKFAESMLDVIKIGSGVLLGSVTGVGLTIGLFILLFVRIP